VDFVDDGHMDESPGPTVVDGESEEPKEVIGELCGGGLIPK